MGVKRKKDKDKKNKKKDSKLNRTFILLVHLVTLCLLLPCLRAQRREDFWSSGRHSTCGDAQYITPTGTHVPDLVISV